MQIIFVCIEFWCTLKSNCVGQCHNNGWFEANSCSRIEHCYWIGLTDMELICAIWWYFTFICTNLCHAAQQAHWNQFVGSILWPAEVYLLIPDLPIVLLALWFPLTTLAWKIIFCGHKFSRYMYTRHVCSISFYAIMSWVFFPAFLLVLEFV